MENKLKLSLDWADNKETLHGLNSVNGNWIIVNKANNEVTELIEKENFIVYSSVTSDEDNYEILEFTNKQFGEDFVIALTNFISKKGSIVSSIDEIESFMKNNNVIDMQQARGIFAELSVLEENSNVKPKEHSNAIYDFDMDGEDLEIKSFSPAKKSFILGAATINE